MNQEKQEECCPVCYFCGGPLWTIKQKLVCSKCHAIVETCCEGGRQ